MLALRHWLSLDKEKKVGGRERDREKETDFEIPQWLDGEGEKNFILIRHKRLTSLSMRTGERSIMGPQLLCA